MTADSVAKAAAAAASNRSDAMGAFGCVTAAWKAHEAELRGYLRHRVADPDVADDVLQDVFVKAMRQGRSFCTLDNSRAWLFQVARNALVDRMRVAHPHESLGEESAEAAQPEPEARDPVDALAGCLARTLGELSPEDADILRACDIGGQTQAGYARARGLSLAATKSRLLRARRRLRKRLTDVCQVTFERDGSVSSHVPRPALPELESPL